MGFTGRLIALGLALAVTTSLALALVFLPPWFATLVGPTVEAWLRSLSPIELALLRGTALAIPGLSASFAAVAGSWSVSHKPKPPEPARWQPGDRPNPFGVAER